MTDMEIVAIKGHLKTIANALTRQAEVMERDVEAEAPSKDIEEALQKQADEICFKYVVFIQELGGRLEDIIVRTYLNDLARARAIRGFCEELKKFEGIKIEEQL